MQSSTAARISCSAPLPPPRVRRHTNPPTPSWHMRSSPSTWCSCVSTLDSWRECSRSAHSRRTCSWATDVSSASNSIAIVITWIGSSPSSLTRSAGSTRRRCRTPAATRNTAAGAPVPRPSWRPPTICVASPRSAPIRSASSSAPASRR